MARTVLQQGVYQQLRGQIIAGRFQPDSTLREKHIAAEFAVSRTPVREVLRRLAEEGFLTYTPHKGARLIMPTPELVREVFDIREALEGIAARQAAIKMDAARLSLLRNHFDALRPRIERNDLSEVGDTIHQEILSACRNRRLERLMSIYHSQVNWFQSVVSHVPGRLLHAFREHEDILCALEARDPEWAENATRSHIRSTLSDLMTSLDGAAALQVSAEGAPRDGGDRPAEKH